MASDDLRLLFFFDNFALLWEESMMPSSSLLFGLDFFFVSRPGDLLSPGFDDTLGRLLDLGVAAGVANGSLPPNASPAKKPSLSTNTSLLLLLLPLPDERVVASPNAGHPVSVPPHADMSLLPSLDDLDLLDELPGLLDASVDSVPKRPSSGSASFALKAVGLLLFMPEEDGPDTFLELLCFFP